MSRWVSAEVEDSSEKNFCLFDIGSRGGFAFELHDDIRQSQPPRKP